MKGKRAMADYISIANYNDDYSVMFEVEDDEILALGERMNELCEDAYMNGYNWDALISCYLDENAPELLDGLDPDPEAGSYCAHYSGTEDNKGRAERLAELITALVEDEERLFDFLRTHADIIEWE